MKSHIDSEGYFSLSDPAFNEPDKGHVTGVDLPGGETGMSLVGVSLFILVAVILISLFILVAVILVSLLIKVAVCLISCS